MGLDTVEFLMDVEESLGIRLDEKDAVKIRTIGQLSEHTAKLLSEKNGEAYTYEETLPTIINILVSKYHIKREWINTSAEFVKDLGMD